MKYQEFKKILKTFELDLDHNCPICGHDHFAGDPKDRFNAHENMVKELYNLVFG